MSSRANMPAFGVSRAGRANNREKNVESTISENLVKIPAVNLNSHIQNLGEIVLNQQDSLLYYSNGQQWIPVAVMNKVVQVTDDHGIVRHAGPDLASSGGSISIEANENPQGRGGNIHISAGQGGLADGEIYFGSYGGSYGGSYRHIQCTLYNRTCY